LAAAALSAERIGVAQADEQRVLAVNLGRMAVADIAAVEGQEAAGADDAGVGNEHHPAAVADAERRAHALAALVATLSPLREHPAEVMPLGGLDREGRGADEIGHLLENPFEILGIRHFARA